MKKAEIAATIVTVVGCLLAWRMGLPTDTLLISAGWLFIASLVVFLAIYRTMLAVHQHHLLKFGPAHADSLISVTRMESLDRWGMFLTIAAIIYSVGFAIVLTEQLFNAVIDRIARMLEFF